MVAVGSGVDEEVGGNVNAPNTLTMSPKEYDVKEWRKLGENKRNIPIRTSVSYQLSRRMTHFFSLFGIVWTISV